MASTDLQQQFAQSWLPFGTADGGDQIDSLTNQAASCVWHLTDPIVTDDVQLSKDDGLSELVRADCGSGEQGASTLLVEVAIRQLEAYLQRNFTGPPERNEWLTGQLKRPLSEPGSASHNAVLRALAVDGIAAYRLATGVEHLLLAKRLLICINAAQPTVPVQWWLSRADFLHQRLLADQSDQLKLSIDRGLKLVQQKLAKTENTTATRQLKVALLLEIATIHNYYGEITEAKAALEAAAVANEFKYILTGRLGKKTRFQQTDISQLVVIAESAGAGVDGASSVSRDAKPLEVLLQDDTLLERPVFQSPPPGSPERPSPMDTSPEAASAHVHLDSQPILQPLDSCILLAQADAVLKMAPSDELIREEALPYVARVLDGGSSNWAIYTQALLTRSRIEAYRARTVERGVLQLQVLVDEIIAATSRSQGNNRSSSGPPANSTTTFLPKAQGEDQAAAVERLKHIFQLGAASRWELEKELAERWINLGAIRTALDIFQRLRMVAESALCRASAGDRAGATATLRTHLFGPEATSSERLRCDLLPTDAPRLLCILGDIEDDPGYYEMAWKVSDQTFARAQRSLGKWSYARKHFEKAAEAFELALNHSPLHHETWFAIGCAHLELSQWSKAAGAFRRAVQLDDADAEAYSNLATALLRGDQFSGQASNGLHSDQGKTGALIALNRAAILRRDNWQIWENVVTIAASMKPPRNLDILTAMSRVIQLRGGILGEEAIDVDILERVIKATIKEDREVVDDRPSTGPTVGLARMVNVLLNDQVRPLITSSARLWRLLALWKTHYHQHAEALEAQEGAWRATINRSGWTTGEKPEWEAVVQATEDIVDAYETTSAIRDGQLLSESQARFKARSAIRSVLGRAKMCWEDSDGWERLVGKQQSLGSR